MDKNNEVYIVTFDDPSDRCCCSSGIRETFDSRETAERYIAYQEMLWEYRTGCFDIEVQTIKDSFVVRCAAGCCPNKAKIRKFKGTKGKAFFNATCDEHFEEKKEFIEAAYKRENVKYVGDVEV